MPKNNISEIVANGMFEVLNSESHAQLFKKAYVQKEAAAPAAAAPAAAPKAPVAPASKPMKADDNDVKSSGKCEKCDRDSQNCYCSDSAMADDNDARKAKKEECMDCGMAKDACKCEHSKADDANDAWSKESKAFNVAMENLLTASAALDYAGLVKGSELALKLAALVSEAKKGKVNLKGDKKKSKPAKKEEKKSDKKSDKSDTRAKLTGKKEEKAEEHLKKLRELGSGKKSK